MMIGDFARGLGDVLRTAVRICGAALAAAQPGKGAAGLALALVMLCGLVSPASAQSQVTISGSTYSISQSGSFYDQRYYALLYGASHGEAYDVAYFAFSIPANRNFTSVKFSYNYSPDFYVDHPINFVSLSGEPSVDAAGQDAVKAATLLATVPANLKTSLDLPEAFLSQMNMLSAAGGGTMWIGAWGPDDVDYSGEFKSVSLEAVAPLPPNISSLSPSFGPLSGGAATLKGTNFESPTLTVGGASVIPTSVTTTTIDFTLPAHAAGDVPIVVTTIGGLATVHHTYVAAPTVTSISPTAGPATGGTSVTITGTNLLGATAVTFGATAATSYTVKSATEITATAPTGTGAVDVRVTTVGGTSATSSADQFTYVGAPTVTSISPASGPTTGGTSVIITGTNLLGATAVTFGATAATGYTVKSATEITATAPTGMGTGTVDVLVTTTGGTSATSAADQFTYVGAPTVTSISPTSGPATGGTSVTITGTNLLGATAVTFGATAATGYTVNSATQITATAPAGSLGTVAVGVTTPGGTSAPSAAAQFTYVGAPTVQNLAQNVAYNTTTSLDVSGQVSGVYTSMLLATGPAHGTLVFNANGTGAYTPVTGYFGQDSFIFTAAGPGGTSAPATVTLMVATPGAPTVAGDSAAAAYNAPTPIDLSASITGVHTSLTVATPPSHGTTSVVGDVVTYTPATGYFGPDSFTYTATGPGGTSAPATVTLTVAAPSAPVAASAAVAVGYEAPQVIDLSGAITGVHTSIAVGTAPAHGAVSVAGDVVTYTPAMGYFGPDSFTYTATGPGGTSAPATVTLTVAAPSAPVAASAAAAVGYETPQAIDLSGAITGVHTSIAVGTAPAHGLFSVAGDVITYTPVTGYFGPDSFTYTATGPGGTSAPATVTLTVAAPAAPVVEQPTDPVVVPPSSGGGSTSINLGEVSQGAVDGYRITAASRFGVAEVTNEAAAGLMQTRASGAPKAAGPYRLVYTPAANFMGTDTVTVVAYGPGGDSAPATFTFQVAGKAPDLSGTVLAGASVTFAPTAGLVGGPFQSLRVTSPPAFGTATVNGLSIVFTPGANGGATAFDYVVDLPFGASAAGRVSLTSNALPGSEALVAQTLQGVPVTVRISDADGGPFTGAAVVSMAPATAGEARIVKVGDDYDLTFVSTGDFSGETVVTYSLSNAFGTTNSTLTVTVEARPDPSLDPEVRGVATSQVTSARRFADAQINNFQQRLRDLHDGTNGSSNGLSLNLGLGGANGDRDPQQALRRQLGQDRSLDPGALGGDRDREMLGLDLWPGRGQAASKLGASDDRLNAASAQPETGAGAAVGLWTSGSVDWGRQDATGQRDSRFTTQGATLGLDVKVSDQLIVGGGVGYGEDKTRIGDNGSVTNGKAFTGAVYASWRPAEAFYVDGVLGYANLDFTSRRWVEGLAGQADGYASGDRSGDVRFASAALGRVLHGERVTSDFYARLDARDITLDGFTETGGGLSALNWDEIEQKSLSANLGASWRWTLDSRRYGQFRPNARVEWSHELEDIGAQGVRYADWTTSPTYLVPLTAWSRNAINLTLGTEWSLSDRLMLSLGYRGALGDASTSHGAQIGMKYAW